MRISSFVLFTSLCLGCSSVTAPEMTRELGTIAFDDIGPEITIRHEGHLVTVTIATYGSSSCTEKGETVTVIEGLEASVTPYNYVRSSATSCTRDLSAPEHEATLQFVESGTVRIVVHGLHREVADETQPLALEFSVTLD